MPVQVPAKVASTTIFIRMHASLRLHWSNECGDWGTQLCQTMNNYMTQQQYDQSFKKGNANV